MSKPESEIHKEAGETLGELVNALADVLTRFYEENEDDEDFCEQLEEKLPRVIQTLKSLGMRSFTASSHDWSNN